MSASIWDFDAVPAVGTVLELDGQEYLLIGCEPHQRQDGTMTTLLVWQTHCAQCSVPFMCRSTVRVVSLNRRCQTHKRPGQRVGGKRRDCPPVVSVRPASL
jgi:hypothetical protein